MLDDVIHVVMSSSKVFLPYCATTMASILFNLDPNRKINFYILSYDIDDKDKKNLRLLSKIKECNVFFPSFDEKLLDMFTGIKIPSHVSKMTYAGSSCICVGKRAKLATYIGLSFRKTSSLKI